MNTTAHLVARALRDRRTITWSYITGGGYNPYYSLTRSEILRDVRGTPDNSFTYGVQYDASRPTPNNGRHGLQAYRIEPPIPQPAPIDHAAALTALRVQRIATDFAALTPEAKAQVLQLQTSLTHKSTVR